MFVRGSHPFVSWNVPQYASEDLGWPGFPSSDYDISDTAGNPLFAMDRHGRLVPVELSPSRTHGCRHSMCPSPPPRFRRPVQAAPVAAPRTSRACAPRHPQEVPQDPYVQALLARLAQLERQQAAAEAQASSRPQAKARVPAPSRPRQATYPPSRFGGLPVAYDSEDDDEDDEGNVGDEGDKDNNTLASLFEALAPYLSGQGKQQQQQQRKQQQRKQQQQQQQQRQAQGSPLAAAYRQLQQQLLEQREREQEEQQQGGRRLPIRLLVTPPPQKPATQGDSPPPLRPIHAAPGPAPADPTTTAKPTTSAPPHPNPARPASPARQPAAPLVPPSTPTAGTTASSSSSRRGFSAPEATATATARAVVSAARPMTRSDAARVIQRAWRRWSQREILTTLKKQSVKLGQAWSRFKQAMADANGDISHRDFLEVQELAMRVLLALDACVSPAQPLRTVRKRLNGLAIKLQDEVAAAYQNSAQCRSKDTPAAAALAASPTPATDPVPASEDTTTPAAPAPAPAPAATLPADAATAAAPVGQDFASQPDTAPEAPQPEGAVPSATPEDANLEPAQQSADSAAAPAAVADSQPAVVDSQPAGEPSLADGIAVSTPQQLDTTFSVTDIATEKATELPMPVVSPAAVSVSTASRKSAVEPAVEQLGEEVAAAAAAASAAPTAVEAQPEEAQKAGVFASPFASEQQQQQPQSAVEQAADAVEVVAAEQQPEQHPEQQQQQLEKPAPEANAAEPPQPVHQPQPEQQHEWVMVSEDGTSSHRAGASSASVTDSTTSDVLGSESATTSDLAAIAEATAVLSDSLAAEAAHSVPDVNGTELDLQQSGSQGLSTASDGSGEEQPRPRRRAARGVRVHGGLGGASQAAMLRRLLQLAEQGGLLAPRKAGRRATKPAA